MILTTPYRPGRGRPASQRPGREYPTLASGRQDQGRDGRLTLTTCEWCGEKIADEDQALTVDQAGTRGRVHVECADSLAADLREFAGA